MLWYIRYIIYIVYNMIDMKYGMMTYDRINDMKLYIWYMMTWYASYDNVIWYEWYDTCYNVIWYGMRYDMVWDMIWYDIIWYMIWCDVIWYDMTWYDMILIYLLTAIGLTPGGNSTVHIYMQKYIEQHN